MITCSEVRVADRNAEYLGIPSETLMENAGRKVAEFVFNHFNKKPVLILCGTGNNGGDGFVTARHLAETNPVTVFLVGHEKDIRTRIAKKNYEKMKHHHIALYDLNSKNELPALFEKATVILDAMLGIGLAGTLREPYISIVDLLNKETKKTIIAVDVPTGFGTDCSVQSTHCITFHDTKEGMTKQHCGAITIVDIGIPKDAVTYIGPGDLFTYYPRPKIESHKGENGRVLIIGGGPYYGAPVLSAMAALRTGADLVHITTPAETAKKISVYSPNFIIHPLMNDSMITNDDVYDLSKYVEKVDAVVIGPGMGVADETMNALPCIVHEILKQKKPLVLDADGLKAMANDHEILLHSPTVLTPHAGEFALFTGTALPDDVEYRERIIRSWAKKLDITIFLKGPIDIISDKELTKLNRIHNQAMTVGGTGDVLAGIIGALLSKKVRPILAARIAAFLNGEAGNKAFNEKSYGLLATDVIEKIPTVLKDYL